MADGSAAGLWTSKLQQSWSVHQIVSTINQDRLQAVQQPSVWQALDNMVKVRILLGCLLLPPAELANLQPEIRQLAASSSQNDDDWVRVVQAALGECSGQLDLQPQLTGPRASEAMQKTVRELWAALQHTQTPPDFRPLQEPLLHPCVCPPALHTHCRASPQEHGLFLPRAVPQASAALLALDPDNLMAPFTNSGAEAQGGAGPRQDKVAASSQARRGVGAASASTPSSMFRPSATTQHHHHHHHHHHHPQAKAPPGPGQAGTQTQSLSSQPQAPGTGSDPSERMYPGLQPGHTLPGALTAAATAPAPGLMGLSRPTAGDSPRLGPGGVEQLRSREQEQGMQRPAPSHDALKHQHRSHRRHNQQWRQHEESDEEQLVEAGGGGSSSGNGRGSNSSSSSSRSSSNSSSSGSSSSSCCSSSNNSSSGNNSSSSSSKVHGSSIVYTMGRAAPCAGGSNLLDCLHTPRLVECLMSHFGRDDCKPLRLTCWSARVAIDAHITSCSATLLPGLHINSQLAVVLAECSVHLSKAMLHLVDVGLEFETLQRVGSSRLRPQHMTLSAAAGVTSRFQSADLATSLASRGLPTAWHNLQSLRLQQLPLSLAVSMALLCSCGHLRELVLVSCSLEGDVARPWQHLPALAALSLESCSLQPQLLQDLQRVHCLRSLRLFHTTFMQSEQEAGNAAAAAVGPGPGPAAAVGLLGPPNGAAVGPGHPLGFEGCGMQAVLLAPLTQLRSLTYLGSAGHPLHCASALTALSLLTHLTAKPAVFDPVGGAPGQQPGLVACILAWPQLQHLALGLDVSPTACEALGSLTALTYLGCGALTCPPTSARGGCPLRLPALRTLSTLQVQCWCAQPLHALQGRRFAWDVDMEGSLASVYSLAALDLPCLGLPLPPPTHPQPGRNTEHRVHVKTGAGAAVPGSFLGIKLRAGDGQQAELLTTLVPRLLSCCRVLNLHAAPREQLSHGDVTAVLQAIADWAVRPTLLPPTNQQSAGGSATGPSGDGAALGAKNVVGRHGAAPPGPAAGLAPATRPDGADEAGAGDGQAPGGAVADAAGLKAARPGQAGRARATPQTLHLLGLPCSKAAMAAVPAPTTTLSLRQCNIDDDGLVPLAQLSNLHRLELQRCTGLGAASLAAFAVLAVQGPALVVHMKPELLGPAELATVRRLAGHKGSSSAVRFV
ncbi:hypothetical protein QJQ45_019112, partial [Haematococcus lacustris]